MKVLIAVDSSSFSTEVLSSVALRRWEPATSFRVLTVVEPSTDWDATQQFLRQCQPILEARVSFLRKAMPKFEIVGELTEGVAAAAIVEIAEQWGADLVVIGSHGDTGVRRLQIGSVAAAVVNNAPCSIEIVKVKNMRTKNHSGGRLLHKERSTAKG